MKILKQRHFASGRKEEKGMGKRYIDCSARELAAYHKKELLQSIADSEGRVLAAETIGTVTPMLVNITNAEFVTSLGADIIMLNIFDVDHPVINGLPEVAPEDTIHEVKRLTGRMVAINLEPAAVRNDGEKSVWSLTEGRRATVENAKKAADMGVDMIVLTGNPGVGVDNKAITKALADLNEAVGDRVILTAGKMHASGILSEAGEKILTKEDAETFIEAGADVLLLPAPGTVPGFTMEHAAELIKTAHEKGVLAMTTIGTSQEGADEETIRQIALMCKMAGADIHHIGDSGYMGMALPENITAYSVAIRGKRHTYRRMAMSLVR
nr:radical SAM protein [Roseburia inulinivorans]